MFVNSQSGHDSGHDAKPAKAEMHSTESISDDKYDGNESNDDDDDEDEDDDTTRAAADAKKRRQTMRVLLPHAHANADLVELLFQDFAHLVDP